MNVPQTLLSHRFRVLIGFGCATASFERGSCGQGRGDAEVIVQGERSGDARSARIRTRLSRCAARSPARRLSKDVAARIEKSESAIRSSIRPTASSSATGKMARKSRRRGAASSSPTTRRAPSAPTATRAISLRRRSSRSARSAPASINSGSFAATAVENAALRLRQDLQLRGVRRVLQHAAFRPQRHSHRAADQGCHRAADGSRNRRSTSDAHPETSSRASALRETRDPGSSR